MYYKSRTPVGHMKLPHQFRMNLEGKVIWSVINKNFVLRVPDYDFRRPVSSETLFYEVKQIVKELRRQELQDTVH